MIELTCHAAYTIWVHVAPFWSQCRSVGWAIGGMTAGSPASACDRTSAAVDRADAWRKQAGRATERARLVSCGGDGAPAAEPPTPPEADHGGGLSLHPPLLFSIPTRRPQKLIEETSTHGVKATSNERDVMCKSNRGDGVISQIASQPMRKQQSGRWEILKTAISKLSHFDVHNKGAEKFGKPQRPGSLI